MTYRIKVGTKLLVHGTTLDDYVIEKITTQRSPDGTKTYTLEARTVRQRCFPRALTGYDVWDGASLLDYLKAGSMRITE